MDLKADFIIFASKNEKEVVLGGYLLIFPSIKRQRTTNFSNNNFKTFEL